MKKLNLFLIITICVLIGGCQKIPWCSAMDAVSFMAKDDGITVIRSCNPYNVHSGCMIINDEDIYVGYRMPDAEGGLCGTFMSAAITVDGVLKWDDIKKHFEFENATFIGWQDIVACSLPDPGLCIVD